MNARIECQSNGNVSESMFKRACASLPGGNTRDTLYYAPHPLYAFEGKGARIIDIDGVERIDFVNNYSSLIHGHGNQAILDAVKKQLNQLPAVGMPTESEIQLAELLCEEIPSVARVRFTNSGTEAVMMALKAARLFTGKSKIAKIEGAYHGSYDWTEISVEPSPDQWGPIEAPTSVPKSGAITRSVVDDVIVLNYNDIEHTQSIIESNADDLAAVLIDPLVSRMGYVAASDAYLQMLRKVTQQCGVLLVFDEIYSLRIAQGGVQNKRNIVPDLTALGKIIGGCFPIGAIGGREDIMSVFDPARGSSRLPHGGTYNGNPVSMAAGYASMRQLTPGNYAHLDHLGQKARDGLQEILSSKNANAQVTGEGSVLAVVPTRNSISNWRDFYECESRKDEVAKFHRHMLNNGILMAPHGTLVLSTAMTDDDIDIMLEAASACEEAFGVQT